MSRIEQFLLGGGRNRAAVHVGLVNNMPDADMRATELQFARLLKDAAGSLDVRLRLFSLSGIARGELARSRMDGFYDDAAFLPAANLDALIVTGTGPEEAREQAYWPELAELIDWAGADTLSTLFSGQAAQAAVMHLDGIVRRPLDRKLSGVFPAMRMEDDPLFFGMPLTTPVPHTRHDDIAEADLVEKGYRVLARLANGHVDMFSREPAGRSRFIFLQGHPEYDRGTLGRDYLREMESFLRGEVSVQPTVPENYFDRATEDQLADIGAQDGAREIVAGALTLQSWRLHTVRLFGNWLTLVAAAKARRMASRLVHTRKRA